MYFPYISHIFPYMSHISLSFPYEFSHSSHLTWHSSPRSSPLPRASWRPWRAAPAACMSSPWRRNRSCPGPPTSWDETSVHVQRWEKLGKNYICLWWLNKVVFWWWNLWFSCCFFGAERWFSWTCSWFSWACLLTQKDLSSKPWGDSWQLMCSCQVAAML